MSVVRCTLHTAHSAALGTLAYSAGGGLLDWSPTGRLIEHIGWKGGSVYPETTRDWWVYVPHQYDPSVPAALLVCQDGGLP